MKVRCEKGGEHLACDRCGRVFKEIDPGGSNDYRYHHPLWGEDISYVFCEECRKRWDAMTKLWINEAVFVVRRDHGWVEVIDESVPDVGNDGKGSAVIGVAKRDTAKPVYSAGRATVIPPAYH